METLIDYIYRVASNNLLVVGIELLLIGLVVYWAIDFLEGTRGERLFRGVVFVLIAVVIILKLMAEKFAFDRLSYLYNGFLIFVLVIAVAAFQPEIRRALIRIGQPRFMPGSSSKLVRTNEEIVRAIVTLSASKTGAIIVVERMVALGELIDTGVLINAEVKSELIRTIFYDGTALHDMALVIRGDRMLAARVQLPLAEAEAMEGIELGSRHRAAIGVTSSCDALAIVVSEETGIISLAENGELVRNVSAAEVRDRLSAMLKDMAAGSVKGKVLQSDSIDKS